MQSSPSSELLAVHLGRSMARAVHDFQMLEEGDRVLVAVSGGKDSYTLLHLLRRLQAKAPVSFTLQAVHVDQGHPGYDGAPLRAYMEREGYAFQIIEEDTYAIVTEKVPEGKTYCSLCSRLRRGILYRVAQELGCNKLALGHHREDVLQTLLLNLFFAGQLGAMPPKLLAENGQVVVIRPLVYCAEGEIAALSEAMRFPILPCNLCGSQESQRNMTRDLLDGLEAKHPHLKSVMLAALANVRPSQLFDRRLELFAEKSVSAGEPFCGSQSG